QGANHAFHLLRRPLLPMQGAGGARDAFVHQGTAKIVGAGIQTGSDTFAAKLHPRSLDVVDMTMQYEPCDSMHQHGFAETRAAPRLSLAIGRSFERDIRQWYEFSEASR